LTGEGPASGPVITTVTRRVRPGHEMLYEEFLEGIISAARRFPGHLGVEVFRPESAAGEYRTVYRFDSEEHLRAWLDSDEHAAWLEPRYRSIGGPDAGRVRCSAVDTRPPADQSITLRLGTYS
jgi:uncharacterized protein